MVDFVCKLCGNKVAGARSFKAHLQINHELNSEFYTLKYIFNNKAPSCFCGCGKKTRYYSFGYKKYRTGHNGKTKACGKTCMWEAKKLKEKVGFVSIGSAEIRNKSIKTLNFKYGVSNPYQIKMIKKKAFKNLRNCIFKRTPQYQIDLFNSLKNVDIGFEIEYPVGKKFVDICHPVKKIAIECNGDYIHCNPAAFKPDYFNKKKNKLARDIWEEDKNKKETLERNGYKVFIFWQSDVLKNVDNVLNIVKEELNCNE